VFSEPEKLEVRYNSEWLGPMTFADVLRLAGQMTVGQLTLPFAQVSLAIANRAVEGTKRLSARVIGTESEIKEAVATTQRIVKRTAKKTVGTARKAVRTVKAKAKARA